VNKHERRPVGGAFRVVDGRPIYRRLLFREAFNKPGVAYLAIPVVATVVIGAIPLFRCKLYRLLGKEKIGVRESLSIKD
jgi:hypothetical protein